VGAGGWAEIDAILDAALDLDPADRPAFLDARCPDPEIRARVERLIASAEATDDTLTPGGALDGRLGEAIADALDPAADAPPDTIAGYRLVRRIGSGGMGEVWEAEQTEPVRRRLAVKLVRPGMDSGPLLARFRSERQTLAHMSHPGIAQVFDAGVTDSGRPFFAMEFVDGPTLTAHCDDGTLPLAERLALFAETCDAVQHAHQKGVIHRDLKPSNVLVATVDGRAVPKVIDFGIARAFEGDLARGTLLTEAGQIVGTPEYMSPEQADADPGDVDTRSDVYALGVLLHELALGALPFEREDGSPAALAELFRRVREVEPMRPSRRVALLGDRATAAAAARRTTPSGLVRALRGDLDWILLRALDKDRAARYASAAELASDVRRHLADEPVVAGPPSAAYRVAKFARRNKGLLTAAAAVLVALVAGLIGTWTGLVRARHEAERARTQAAIAVAVNEFLNDDLLSAAAPDAQGRDVTVLEALDTASTRLEGRFADQPEVEASVRGTIADTYTRLGRFDAASPHAERALSLFEAALGPDHPETLDALQTLAELRYYQGRVDESEVLFERLVEGRRRALGPDDARTLSAMSDLGAVHQDRGRLDEAERRYREALDRAVVALGPDDESTLAMFHNLGALLRDRGRLDEAEPLLRRAWEGSRTRLGPDHPETLASLSMLGSVVREQGRLEDAEAIDVEVFESRRRVLGDEHPSTLTSANNLAMVRNDLGRHAEAERLQRFALDGQRAVLGEDHDATILSLSNLGAILVASGRPAEAEPLLDDAVARARRTLGDGHALTGNVVRKLGDALAALGRRERAEAAYLEAHATLAAALGADHSDARRAAAALASLYASWDRPADAAAWRERSD